MSDEEIKELSIKSSEELDRLKDKLLDQEEEIERLNKENNDLRKLYQRTYKHLFEIGNDELARYFQAQIDECRTFYVEPIIDYYKETKRLNNIIDKAIEYIEDNMSYVVKGNKEYIPAGEELLDILGGKE